MTRVLVVEDDPALARGLLDNLRFEGYEVQTVGSAEEAQEQLEEHGWDVMLLDLMLPGKNGFDLLRELSPNETCTDTPRIIVVSARDAEVDIVRALDLGAHDYVRKPFSLGELLARVKCQSREKERSSATPKAEPEEDTPHFGDVRVSFRRFRLWKGRQEHLLSHIEAELLRFFLDRPDTPLRRRDILSRVWGDDVYPTERTVDNFIVKLRRKIEDDPSQPRKLITVHGIGYRFLPDG